MTRLARIVNAAEQLVEIENLRYFTRDFGKRPRESLRNTRFLLDMRAFASACASARRIAREALFARSLKRANFVAEQVECTPHAFLMSQRPPPAAHQRRHEPEISGS